MRGLLGDRTRWVLVLLVSAVVLAACDVSVSAVDPRVSSTAGSTERPSNLGPFVESDPAGIIVEARWVDPRGLTPALPQPIPNDELGAVLLETSEPDLLRIAVNGSGCVPETAVSAVNARSALELRITLSEPTPEPGLQCSDLLTTHAFELVLTEPVALDKVVLFVTR